MKCREAMGREASPTACVIDSQSVKGAEKRGRCIDPNGYDAGEEIKGKKRHILVDTLGLRPLWLTSNAGGRMTYSSVERSLTETTRLTPGLAVSPHLFRACAATAIYTHAGGNPNLAGGVLLHIDRRVTEEHYNRATSISAARQYAEIVKSTRA